MDVPTLQLPDDDDTTPQIFNRCIASAPISNISDSAHRAREGSTSDEHSTFPLHLDQNRWPFDAPTGLMGTVNGLGTQTPLQPASQSLAIGECPSSPELDSGDDFILEVRKCWRPPPEVTCFVSHSLTQALSFYYYSLDPRRPMTHPPQKRPHFSGESATGSLDKSHLRRMIHPPMQPPLLRRPFGPPSLTNMPRHSHPPVRSASNTWNHDLTRFFQCEHSVKVCSRALVCSVPTLHL